MRLNRREARVIGSLSAFTVSGQPDKEIYDALNKIANHVARTIKLHWGHHQN